MTTTGTFTLPLINTPKTAVPKASCLYIGPSGAGKTFCATSWPKWVYLSVDPRLSTVESLPDDERGPIIDCRDLNVFHGKILPLIEERGLTEAVRQIPGFEDYTVETVIFDSLTHYGYLLYAAIWGNPGKYTNNRGVVDTQAMWNEYGQRMRITANKLLFVTREEPGKESYNSVQCVHEREMLNENGTVRKVVSALQGQFGEHIIWQFFDTILRLYKQGRTYYAESVGNNLYPYIRDDRGGEGKRFKPLPDKLVGGAEYATLCQHWGIKL